MTRTPGIYDFDAIRNRLQELRQTPEPKRTPETADWCEHGRGWSLNCAECGRSPEYRPDAQVQSVIDRIKRHRAAADTLFSIVREEVPRGEMNIIAKDRRNSLYGRLASVKFNTRYGEMTVTETEDGKTEIFFPPT